MSIETSSDIEEITLFFGPEPLEKTKVLPRALKKTLKSVLFFH